jgi:hypothetical protein
MHRHAAFLDAQVAPGQGADALDAILALTRGQDAHSDPSTERGGAVARPGTISVRWLEPKYQSITFQLSTLRHPGTAQQADSCRCRTCWIRLIEGTQAAEGMTNLIATSRVFHR